MEEAAAHLVLLLHHRDRFGLIHGGPARAPALGVGRERSFEFMREPEVVDDEAARLVPEDPVHARDRLHQPVAAHRLVHVHGVQARRVEAGQPHVPHEDDLKGIAGIAEPFRQALAAPLVADVRLPFGGSEALPVITTLMRPLSSSS